MTADLRTIDDSPRPTAEDAAAAHLMGWNLRCNRCGLYGATWSDGERLRSTGTRNEAVAHAKRLWEQAGPFDRAAYERWLREKVGDLVETVEVSP